MKVIMGIGISNNKYFTIEIMRNYSMKATLATLM